jgi:hypothetical protein
MLRKEACSGGIDDLAHVRTAHCLSDCLTKHSAKPGELIKAVETGVLPYGSFSFVWVKEATTGGTPRGGLPPARTPRLDLRRRGVVPAAVGLVQAGHLWPCGVA